MILQPTRTGTQLVSISGDYQVSNLRRFRSFNHTMDVSIEDISIDLFISDNLTIEAGRETPIRIAISQPGTKHDFQKLRAIVSSDYDLLKRDNEFRDRKNWK